MTSRHTAHHSPFFAPLIIGLAIVALLLAGIASGEETEDRYSQHGLKRLVDRVIYEEDGEYKGSIPKMQSRAKSGFKIAAICGVASKTLKAIYKKDLNGVAEYYSNLFGEVYTMALDSELSAADGAQKIYQAGHSDNTAKWAGQRLSIIRSTMRLLHSDLAQPAPAGMPELDNLLGDPLSLTGDSFATFMVDVKKKAGSSDALTTNMAAALASSPAKLNGLVDKCSFLIKTKIAGLLADPAGGDSEVPVAMRTSPDKFNAQNVGDLYLALGVIALHIQNPDALSRAGVTLPADVLAACNQAKAQFTADNKAINQVLSSSKQGKAIWESAPLGPAEIASN